MRNWNVAVGAMGVVAAAGMALAGVSPTAEFNGTASDGFEAIAPPGGYSGPLPIFSGAATMNDTITNFNVIALSWSGPAGQVLPFNGNLMGGTIVGSSMFTFSTPVTAFGGYMTTVGTLSGGSVVFRDVGGGVIDTLSLSVTPLEWNWQGWTSTTPVGSIEVIGANVPGISLQFDDLQANFVPAPGAAAVMVLGGLALSRRRR